MHHYNDQQRDLRRRLAAATITGLVAGAARAVIDWLLHQVTSAG